MSILPTFIAHGCSTCDDAILLPKSESVPEPLVCNACQLRVEIARLQHEIRQRDSEEMADAILAWYTDKSLAVRSLKPTEQKLCRIAEKIENTRFAAQSEV